MIFDFFVDFVLFLFYFFFDERGCCKCEKKYTMLVHNLKTSKTGVFDVIKGVNSPPQAGKKSVFSFFCIQLKGIPPPWWGGGFGGDMVYKPRFQEISGI